MNSARSKAYFFLLLTAIIWGVAAVVIKFTLKGISPLPFLTYRFFLSALIALISFIFIKPKLPKKPILIIWVIIFSLLSTVFGLGFLFLGLNQTTVLNLSLIALIGPLLLALAGVIFLKEHMTKREKIGAAVAFGGAFFTIIEPVLESGGGLGSLSGNILIILYLVSDITSVIILKKLLRDNISALTLTHISFLIAFLVILPIYLTRYNFSDLGNTIANLSLVYHAGVWYMAIFSGTIAYALRAKAQKTIKVEQASLFGYLTTVFTAPLAVLWLGEQITPLFVIGALIIASGVFIAEFKTSKN